MEPPVTQAGNVPPASRSGDIQYVWDRFWAPHAGIVDLSEAGFMRDPGDLSHGIYSLKRLDALSEVPALVLLGEPGMGKSTVLKLEHERLLALGAPNTAIQYTDLKTSSSEDRLYRQIFESPAITAWKGGAGHLTLHLDSLDEAMLRIETIPHLLAEGIRGLPTDRLSVRIACRTAVWPADTLGNVLREIWGEAGLGLFELTPLRRCDVLAAAVVNCIDPDEFVRALFSASAVPFAIKPLTLKMLLSLYQRTGSLPTSTADLYRQGCLALCEEQNPSRRDTRLRGRLNPPQRLRLAGRIATATVLGRRFAVWAGVEAEMPPEDIAVSALAGIQELGDFPAFTVTDDDVREVLDTGLFSARGDTRLGWAHQTYGEFLAALYLHEKKVPAATLLKALTHPKGGLFPPLAVLGAWAASLSPELRPALILSEPWALLRGDLSNWAQADLETLVSSMLDYVEAGRFCDRFFGMSETYKGLNHRNLVDQLSRFIVNRSLKTITRRMACSIAEHCELKQLQPRLLTIALDQTEDPMVRGGAIAALRCCGDASAPLQILALLQAGIGPDPHAEIRGYALNLLWPDHITALQLFSFLAPSDEHYFGSYESFVFNLAETLETPDLLPALDWATQNIQCFNPMGEFRDKTLADAIMFRAWEAFEEPQLTIPFLAHMAARFHQNGELFRGTSMRANDAFKERLQTDTNRRRQFILLLCQTKMDRAESFPYCYNGIVRAEDFDWLLSISPGGAAPVPGLSEESLCFFISYIFKIDNNEQFELLFPVSQHWPNLHAQYTLLLDGILINSPEATHHREFYKHILELKTKKHPPAVADLPSEISSLLSRAQNGEWQAWCLLNLYLMLTPDAPSIYESLNYFITKMPRWNVADIATRQRIVATARTYLVEASSSVEKWFGQNPMTLTSNDISAIRALILLHQEAPDEYAALPTAVWEKWAPVIVGLRLPLNDDASGELRRLLPDALAKAPATFIPAVRKMIHTEKERAKSQLETHSNTIASSFHFLHDLTDCVDADLNLMLFEEMQNTDLEPAEYAALLTALIDKGFMLAIQHAVVKLDNLEENSVMLAGVLINKIPKAIWPELLPKLSKDDAWARSVFLQTAQSSYHAKPFYADFTAEEIADLYLLLERLLPSMPPREPVSGWVRPQDMISDIRDGIPRYLAASGTVNAVHALIRLVKTKPDLALLPFELSRAEAAMRLKCWSPLSVKEIFALTDRTNVKLITSPGDLLDILTETLTKFSAELHGAQTPVRALWDLQKSTKFFMPIDENGFSDRVAEFLNRELVGTGIFANREVEVSRQPGAPVGRRTDILVNAIRHGPGGTIIDSITAVIEVKGCWNKELLSALNDQLVSDYMFKLRAPVGIYLVGWFDKTRWDNSDNRRNMVPKKNVEEVRKQLEDQATAISSDFLVKSIIMEIFAPGI